MKYARIAQAIAETPWAIEPAKLGAIVEFVQAKGFGMEAPSYEAAQRTEPQRHGAVAVLPIRGTIVQRANMLTDFSGGLSLEQLTAQFRSAVNDPAVSAIVLDIDSPGGSVYGVQEFADEVRTARESKPVVAVANSRAASAAYWIAASASELVVPPSGEVGSVGVIVAHTDYSIMNEAVGVKVTYITAGDYKAEGNPDEPLDAEARSFLQSRVDEYYQAFVNGLAKGRGVSAQQVVDAYGQGRMFSANKALAAGMVDRIETFDQTIARLQPKRTPARSQARAHLNRLQLT